VTDTRSNEQLHDLQREHHAQQLAETMRRFRERRPPVFAAEGHLPDTVRAWADAFLAGTARNLILGGPVGTGKTWAAWKLIEHLLTSGWRGTCEVVASYELKAATDLPVDRDRLQRWARASFLVLDDLGAVPVNDWAAGHLYALIDQRWQRQLPTVLTGNADQAGTFDVAALVGARAASRLADGATVVVLKGTDRRRAR